MCWRNLLNSFWSLPVLGVIVMVVMGAVGQPAVAAKTDIEVYNSYFVVDELRPNYKWREGWPLFDEKGQRISHTEHFKQGGYFLIYLRNNDNQPVSVEKIILDGVGLEESRKNLQTIWHKVEPNPIPPGAIAEVTIRIREIKTEVSQIDISGSGGTSVDVQIPLISPQVLFESIAFSGNGEKMYAYLSTALLEEAVAKVEFDGREISRNDIKTYMLTGGVLPLMLRFEKQPLVYGLFHTIKVKTASGDEVAVRFRVLDDFFNRMVFAHNYPPRTAEEKERVFKDFNVISANPRNWGEKIRYFNPCTNDEIREWVNTPSNYIHYLEPDEPDCRDFSYNEIKDPHMRIGANAAGVVEKHLKRHNLDKVHPTALVINATFKPSNYYTYARIPDICTSDPYSNAGGETPSYVYNVIDICHLAARPAPVWAFLYSSKDANSPFGYFRYASNPEIRMETYYAVGRGVKGIGYWWYGSEHPYYGLVDNLDLWNEISRLMAEMRIAEKFLAGASWTPVKIARTPNTRVQLLSLLNIEQGCAVSVINDDFIMTAEKFETNPVKNVEVAVSIPSWQKLEEVYHLSGGTVRPISYTRKAGEVYVRIDEVSSGSMLILATAEGKKHIENNLKREDRR